MVIDDSLALLHTVRGALERAGYEVETSSKPMEMASDLSRVRPDLVLLDIETPEVRGTEVLATLRENAAEIQAWVALFSGCGEEELARLTEEVGAQGWIRKAEPFNAGRLAREVRRLLRAREEARERGGTEWAVVVDDSRAMRRVLRGVLEGVAYEVLEAGDGREALERIEAEGVRPRLLLVDLNMPVMNGYEFLSAVRGSLTGWGARVLMVASETDRARIQQALEAGADEYLMKPFTRESLLEKLEFLGVPLG